MSPENKAKQLLFKFYDIADVDMTRTKACALICIDEKIDTLTDIIGDQKHMWSSHESSVMKDLNEMKQEINKTK